MPKFLSSIIFLFLTSVAVAQTEEDAQIIEEIVAIVGNEIVLSSELSEQVTQTKQQLGTYDVDKCKVFEELLVQKLMLNQAKVDSVEANEAQINSELDRRLNYFVQQLGSEKKLEEFYEKSMVEIRADFYDLLSDQLSVQAMQGEITKDLRITPADVKKFFESIPVDSIPLIDEEIEYAQIIFAPRKSTTEVDKAKNRLEEYRSQVLKKEKDFATLAVIYSEDPGSATNGGELGMVPKGAMVAEFDAVAFGLQDGEVSNVFKTQFGYHLMQMIERRGQKYNARHILLRPKVLPADLALAKQFADSISDHIIKGTLSFAKAAEKHSDDELTKNNEGVVMNPSSGNPRFALNAIDGLLFGVIDKLEEGEISEPVLYVSATGEQSYRVVKLLKRKKAHRANLTDDYNIIKTLANQLRRVEIMKEWVKEKIEQTYIRVNENQASCNFEYKWIKKQP
jgi:peptidyl-prolyl cis-trans isomerase SurA